MIPPAALAAVPGVADGAPPRVVPLAGGLVNRSYRVTSTAGEFVLRLNAGRRTALELGIERDAECAAQRLAAAAGLAPRLLAVAGDHAWQLSEFVLGDLPDATALATPRTLERLGATLARLRAIDLAGANGLPAGPSLIERARALLARATRLVPAATAEFAALRERAELGWHASRACGNLAACLVHSDPGPGNVLLPPGDAPALLIDWEYAHRGDPLQDPAAWLHACPALRGQEARLLRACALEERADVAMLAGMAQVYESIELAWTRLAATAGWRSSGRAGKLAAPPGPLAGRPVGRAIQSDRISQFESGRQHAFVEGGR